MMTAFVATLLCLRNLLFELLLQLFLGKSLGLKFMLVVLEIVFYLIVEKFYIDADEEM